MERAIDLHGVPEKITIDKSGANIAAIQSVNADSGAAIELRQSKPIDAEVMLGTSGCTASRPPVDAQFPYAISAELVVTEVAQLHARHLPNHSHLRPTVAKQAYDAEAGMTCQSTPYWSTAYASTILLSRNPFFSQSPE